MATIPRYPEQLLNEHMNWHMNMGMGMRPGDGLDFLRFHREFMQRSLRWYRRQGFRRSRVEPWVSIPPEVKSHPLWNMRLQQAEARILGDLSSFASPDDLGLFLLATSLHDSVHIIGAEVYNDPDFGQIASAPRSTLFYNWHGLIDQWWKQLERNNRT